MKKADVKASEAAALLDRIKILAVQAMFSDDELLEQLVLMGGNAMALVHQISARASVDLDFSLKQDFGDDVAGAEARIHKALTETFRASGYEVFDFRMIEKPRAISEDMRHFWGDYAVEFKLASAEVFAEHRDDLEVLRRRAVNLGLGTKFLIDISRFEYVDDKQPVDLEGYMIYVYPPVMIVCEKLRAICQQMPEYGPIIKRDRVGSARARDFVDVFVLMDTGMRTKNWTRSSGMRCERRAVRCAHWLQAWCRGRSAQDHRAQTRFAHQMLNTFDNRILRR